MKTNKRVKRITSVSTSKIMDSYLETLLAKKRVTIEGTTPKEKHRTLRVFMNKLNALNIRANVTIGNDYNVSVAV